MTRAQQNYNRWHDYTGLDLELRYEIEAMKGKANLIEEAFGQGLEFGTAGLRGIIGAGTNRMNIYTVRKASLGLARYIIKSVRKPWSIAISYDSRRQSRRFAEEAAKVFANNGIKSLIFDQMQPVPLLSFAVLLKKASAGVMVTASHNPKEYNGYKVYWEHGGQVVEEFAYPLMDEFNGIEDELTIETMDFDKAVKAGLIEPLGDDTKDLYMDAVLGLLANKQAILRHAKMPIVYTPLHGTGSKLVPEALSRAGFTGIRYVEEQMVPDTEFSTVAKPNPEEPEVYKKGLELAKACGADLIIATDPDADRLGAMSREKDGTFRLITGNQMGGLLIDYLLRRAGSKAGSIKNGVMIKTIVTSDLGASIARKAGVEVIDVLTGFKYIGELIDRYEKTKERTFIFGYEESYGYLAGGFVRDKDAVQIALLVAEMAASLVDEGLTLGGRLDALYEEHGFFVDEVVNISLAGIEGQNKIARIMSSLRHEPPFVIGANRIVSTADYESGKISYSDGRDGQPTGLPSSNVLKYMLEDGSWVCIRPSGTEPKLKIYVGAKAKEKRQAAAKAEHLKSASKEIVEGRG